MVIASNDEISIAVYGKIKKHVILWINTNLKPFPNLNGLHVLNEFFYFMDSPLKRNIALKLLPPRYLSQLVPCRGAG